MKQSHYLFLLTLTSFLAFSFNTYATTPFCQESNPENCEKFTLLSPRPGSEFYTSHGDFPTAYITIQVDRTGTWGEEESETYTLIVKDEDGMEKCTREIKPHIKDLTYPYYGYGYNYGHGSSNTELPGCPLTPEKMHSVIMKKGSTEASLGSFKPKGDDADKKYVSFYQPLFFHRINQNVNIADFAGNSNKPGLHIDYKVYTPLGEEIASAQNKELNPTSLKWSFKDSKFDFGQTDPILGVYLFEYKVHGSDDQTTQTYPFFVDKKPPVVRLENTALKYVALEKFKAIVYNEGSEIPEQYATLNTVQIKHEDGTDISDFFAAPLSLSKTFLTDKNGILEFSFPQTLSTNGKYKFEISLEDRIKNLGNTSDISIEITDPAGTFSADTLTSDTETTVVSGQGVVGSKLTIKVTHGGEEKVVETTVKEDGTWSVTVETPNEGEYALTSTPSYKSKKGTPTNATLTIAFKTPTLAGDLAAETVAEAPYDIKGEGENGRSVVIEWVDSANQVVAGSTVSAEVGADGKWAASSTSPSTAGTYTLRIKYEHSGKSITKEVTVKAKNAGGGPQGGVTQPGNGGQPGGQGGTNGGDGQQSGQQGGSQGSNDSKDEGGCGCATSGHNLPEGGFLLALLGMVGWVSRRRSSNNKSNNN